MTTHFFLPQKDGMDLEDMWLEQDGATCHTARESMALLHETFPGREISRLGDRNWPPGSCSQKFMPINPRPSKPNCSTSITD